LRAAAGLLLFGLRFEVEQLGEVGEVVRVGVIGLAREADAHRPVTEGRAVERGDERGRLRVGHLDGRAAADECDLPDVLAVELAAFRDELQHVAGRAPRRDRLDVDDGHSAPGERDWVPSS
jgi:hypothetical protein